MVQIIEGKKSFGTNLVEGLSKTLPDALEKLIERKRQSSQLEEEDTALEKQGIHVRGIKNPKLREALLSEHQEKNESEFGKLEDEEQKKINTKYFGPEYAELYSIATEGGKTDLQRLGLDTKVRNGDLKAVLGQYIVEHPENFETEKEENPSIEEGQLPGMGKPTENKIGKLPKEKVREEELGRKESLEFHKESKDYEDSVRESAKRAHQQIEAIKDIRDAVSSGKVKPHSFSNIFKGMGKIGDKLSDAFLNAEQGKIEAALPLLLEGWKEVFGVRLSDADLKVLQSKLPSIGKDQKANKSILDIVEKYAKPNILRGEIARELRKKNKGLRPLNFENAVEEELEKRLAETEEVIVIAPNGKKKKVPKKHLDEVLNAGGKLAQ